MGMGKLFTAMFVKIVDIGFYLNLFRFSCFDLHVVLLLVSRLRFKDQSLTITAQFFAQKFY